MMANFAFSSSSNITGSIFNSGTLNSPATGSFTFRQLVEETIFSFTAEDTGSFYIAMTGQNQLDQSPTFQFYINDQLQYIDQVYEWSSVAEVFGAQDASRQASRFAQFMVNSGDVVSMKNEDNSGFYDTNTIGTGIIESMYIGSPTGVGTYYMSKGLTNETKHGSFQRFQQRFKNDPSTSANFNSATLFPTFIGGNHIISDYRITLGSASDNGISKTRYRDNFQAPTESFSTDRDSYIDLGENISLTKTRYGKTREFFVLENPITNQPWTTGLVANPSGLILGVRKT